MTTFQDVYDLMEGKPNAWDKIKPVVHIALLAAPGLIWGGFTTAVSTIAVLGMGVTLSDAMEKLDTSIFSINNGKRDFTAGKRAEIVNVVLMFTAYFDAVSRTYPDFWRNLNLKAEEAQYLTEKALRDWEPDTQQLGMGGQNLMKNGKANLEKLTEFYSCLTDRLTSFAEGLNMSCNLCEMPALAAELYQGQFDELMWTSSRFRQWVEAQYRERVESSLEALQLGLSTGVLASQSKLHLPVGSTLGLGGFIGREKELSQIAKAVEGRECPIIVTGLGGMGKTELVKYFAQKHKAEGKGEAYFVTFRKSFHDTIISAIAKGIDNLLDQKLSDEEIYRAVIEHLRNCGDNDILIIDNVDADNGRFADFIDESYYKLCGLPMRLIVTSRFSIPRSVNIGPLAREELYQIFLNHGVDVLAEKMDELIDAVDQHTMTIDLMARMMVGSWRKVTADDLLEALREKKLTQYQREITSDYNREDGQKRIYDHLRTVFNVAGVPDAAKSVLQCAVLLPQDGMDSETFGNALPEDQQNVLDDLIGHGWIEMRDGLISIHPIIRLVCREELKPTDDSCRAFLTSIWHGYDNLNYDAVKLLQLAELYSNACSELPDHLGHWAHSAGFFWKELGRSMDSLKYEVQMVNRMESSLSPEDPKLATAYVNLGYTYGRLGNLQKELEYLTKALRIQEKVLPSDHLDVASTYNHLGSALATLYDPQDALTYLLKSKSIREEKLPRSHLSIAETYNNLGFVYGDLGNHGLALDYLLKSLKIREAELPNDHPDIAKSHNNLGTTFSALGDNERALTHKLKALEIRKQKLPDNHPELAESYNNVGSSYCDMSDPENALKYMLKALEIREHILPEGHPALAVSYNNLGYVYGELGDHITELEYRLKALSIWQKVFPSDHPNIATALNNVGSTYYSLGDYDIALQYLLKSLKIREKVLPANHPELAASLNNLGSTYDKLGNHEKALNYKKRALEILQNTLPWNHPKIVTTCNNIACTLMELGRYDEAKEYTQH